MMKKTGIILGVLALWAITGAAQDGTVTARRALAAVAERFGGEAVGRVFEVRATEGSPQPEEWWMTAADLERSEVLHDFWTDGRRATDEGRNADFYPDKLPKGFFSPAKVRLDSTQAFAITEQLARDAQVGFESVNYLLHGREYSDEPVWTLSLLDPDERLVGSVHLSAESGRVLRTVWQRPLKRGRWQIIDSARDRVPLHGPAPVPAVGPRAAVEDPGFGTASLDGEGGPQQINPEEKSELPVPADAEGKFRRAPAPVPAPAPTVPAPPARMPAPPTDSEVPEIIKLNEAEARVKEQGR